MRGAWSGGSARVASREGGVDRNRNSKAYTSASRGRLPRGGRGSQLAGATRKPSACCRLPRGGRGSQPSAPRRTRPRLRVASREGGVDRNWKDLRLGDIGFTVASREGGVDRNTVQPWQFGDPFTSRLPRGGRGSQQPLLSSSRKWGSRLREGGVDRNSSRRPTCAVVAVASREGGRGSQPSRLCGFDSRHSSPPARGAWIATCS